MLNISICKVIGNSLNFRFQISDLSLTSSDLNIVLRNAMR